MASGYATALQYPFGYVANISSCSWSIIIGLVVVILASVAGWFLSPKGETQTYVHQTPIPSLAMAPSDLSASLP